MDHAELLGPEDKHADLLGPTPSFPRGGFAREGIEAENPIEQAAGVGRVAARAIEAGAGKTAEALGRVEEKHPNLSRAMELLTGLPKGAALVPLAAAETVGELLPKTKTDVVLTSAGFIPEAALGLTGQAAKTIAKKLAPETVDAIARAAAMKIPLTAAEVLQSHALSYVEEGLARVPFASGMLETFRGLRDAAVKDARDKLVEGVGEKMGEHELGQATQEKVGGVLEKAAAKREAARETERDALLGKSPTHNEAGTEVQRSLKATIDPEKKEAGKMYQDVAKSIPKDRNLYPLDTARKVATNALKEKGGDYPTISKELAADLQAIADGGKSGKGQTWEKMHDLQSSYGKIAQKYARNGDAIGAGIYRDLKQGVRDDMEKFSKSIGGDAYKKYDAARENYLAFKNKYGNENVQKLLDMSPDALYKTVVRPDRVEMLRDLKSVVGEEGIEPLRRKFVEDLVGASDESVPKTSAIVKKLADYREVLPDLLDKRRLAQVQKFAARGEMPAFVESAVEKRMSRMLAQTPQQVVHTVMSGDPLTAEAVKNLVGDKGWEPYRRHFMERVLGESGSDMLKPDVVLSKLEHFDPAYRDLFLSPAEQQDIRGLTGVQNLLGSAERLAPLGNKAAFMKGEAAGAGIAAGGLIFSSGARGALLAHPLTGTATLLTPPVLAKFYLSEEGRKLLTEGLDPAIKASAKQAAVVAARIAVFANNARREAGEPEEIEPETKDQAYPTRVEGAPDPATLSPAARGLLGL